MMAYKRSLTSLQSRLDACVSKVRRALAARQHAQSLLTEYEKVGEGYREIMARLAHVEAGRSSSLPAQKAIQLVEAYCSIVEADVAEPAEAADGA